MADGAERLDGIELAITQLADAVELLASAVASGRLSKHLEDVLAQADTARRYLGTDQ